MLRSSLGSVLALAIPLGVPSVLFALLAACSHDTDVSASLVDAAAPAPDARVAPSGPTIEVTTRAPAVTIAAAPKASATWAAYSLDDGEWKTIAPASEGTYLLPVPALRWAIALVCASGDDALSTVFVHRRLRAAAALEVALEDYCTPPAPPEEFALDGTLLHVPASTQWLDFGYARTSRGDAIPAAGNMIPYEVVGIAPGTWDLTFGVRADSFGTLTRVVIQRGAVITADTKLDVDMTGPGAFTPGTKRLALRGIAPGDTVTPLVLYGAGGPYGIDLGPQDVPADKADVMLSYATVPEPLQIATDRYRGTLGAEHDHRSGGRAIVFDLHQAIDLDLTFLPDPPPPLVRGLSGAPQLRLETRFPVLASAARHEVRATTSINRRTRHVWLATFDAASLGGAAEVVDGMPALAALPGWKSDWNLQPGVNVDVLATAYETPRALGDGTVQRSSSKATTVSP